VVPVGRGDEPDRLSASCAGWGIHLHNGLAIHPEQRDDDVGPELGGYDVQRLVGLDHDAIRVSLALGDLPGDWPAGFQLDRLRPRLSSNQCCLSEANGAYETEKSRHWHSRLHIHDPLSPCWCGVTCSPGEGIGRTMRIGTSPPGPPGALRSSKKACSRRR